MAIWARSTLYFSILSSTLERRRIPAGIDYQDVQSLRLEARQKLERIRPETLGQASRIAGVSPADVAVLQVYLEKHKELT